MSSRARRDFAANVGIQYQTPEEFFLGEKPRAFTRTFDPTSYLRPDLRNTDTKGNSDALYPLQRLKFPF